MVLTLESATSVSTVFDEQHDAAHSACTGRTDVVEPVVLDRRQRVLGVLGLVAEFGERAAVLAHRPGAADLADVEAVAVDRPGGQPDQRALRRPPVGQEEAEVRLADAAHFRAAELLQRLHEESRLALGHAEIGQSLPAVPQLPLAALAPQLQPAVVERPPRADGALPWDNEWP